MTRKEKCVDLLTRLHGFWVCYDNPYRGSCIKLFVGRGSYASASVIAGFVPTGVMVMHKALLAAESPQDIADAVLAYKVGPDRSESLRITV